MYGPAPPRRKKTRITRSKTGCVSCRQRRKKCDEQRPRCSDCVRLGKRCEQPSEKIAFRTVSFPAEWESSSRVRSLAAEVGERAAVGVCLDQEEPGEQHNSVPGYVGLSNIQADEDNSSGIMISPNLMATIADVETCPASLDDATAQHSSQPHPDETAVTLYDNSPLSYEQSYPLDSANSSAWRWDNPSPSTDNLLSLEVARALGQRTFYFDNWERSCIPALHPALGRLGEQLCLPPVLRDALLALSACQLSRTTPRGKPFDSDGTPGLSFKPEPNHQTVSLELYGSALLSLARWSNTMDANGLQIVLTAMILLSHLELLMGDFRQFASHSMGVNKILTSSTMIDTVPDHWTCELIANWTQAKAHCWWLRFHFSTPDYHRNSESLGCCTWLTTVLEEAIDNRAVIIAALCECCRLKSVAFLDQWESAPTQKASWSTTPAVTAQRTMLDRWHNRLALSELPIEAFPNAPSLAYPAHEKPLDVQPLRFTSHRAAINYAYYVVSRLFLCGIAAVDCGCSSSNPCEASDHGANFWAHLLARITAALEWHDCTRLNTFTIGLSTLFIPCALDASDTRISLWMLNWLEQRYSTTALEEGSFPVLQALQALRAVHRERREGRVAKAVFACSEDEGGVGKYGSYNSQNITSLLVNGHDITNGQNYSRITAL